MKYYRVVENGSATAFEDEKNARAAFRASEKYPVLLETADSRHPSTIWYSLKSKYAKSK